MPDSSPTSLIWHEAGFDELCHDLRNPLMVIQGHAQLVERAILRSTEVPEAERARILHSLAAIEEAVVGIVEMIDDTSSSDLVGNMGGKASPVGLRSS